MRFEGSGEMPVDLVVGKRSWQAAIVSRAERQALLGVLVPVVRAADLVLLKLYAGGPQDRWDILQIETHGTGLPAVSLAALGKRGSWQRLESVQRGGCRRCRHPPPPG